MRKMLALLLVASAALTPQSSAAAEVSDSTKVRVRLDAPRSVDHDTARLRGKVTGRHAVTLQTTTTCSIQY